MKIIRCLIFFIIFILLIIFFGKLVSLKYVSEYVEGSFTSDYYYEKNHHDVIFLGDCEAYTSFSPIAIYENSGITSFVRGNSQQLIGQSYYLLKETLKYEIPKIVVLSVGSMRYSKQVKEEYNRLMIDKMRWSKEKVDLISYSMVEGESFLSYVFPLLRYHSRITSLTNEDFEYLFRDKIVSHNGFIINKEIKAVSALPSKDEADNKIFSDENIEYLNKIYDLCKENDITLILEKSPTLYPFWYDEYETWISNYAKEKTVDYYNFKEMIDKIGIDFNYDTYDGGIHLNLYGATKLSKYFSDILKIKYSLTDHRLEKNIKEEYDSKVERYYEVVNEKNN